METIPEDTQAKEISQQYKKRLEKLPVLLIAFNDDAAQLQFLKRFAQAIDDHYQPAFVKGVGELGELTGYALILAAESGLDDALVTKIGKTPLIKLADIPIYLQQPKLKAPLWKAVGEILANG